MATSHELKSFQKNPNLKLTTQYIFSSWFFKSLRPTLELLYEIKWAARKRWAAAAAKLAES